MFSDSQQKYIGSLVSSMRDEYPYYIAYSAFANSTSGSPQIYVIFSKEKITANNMYSYQVPSGCIYEINTNNYSSYNSTGARQEVNSYSGGTLQVPKYEFIYTNAEFSGYSMQPDLNQIYGGDYNAQLQTQTFIFVLVGVLALILSIINYRRM